MYCQLVEICGCVPARIRHALADLPETLDETYERTLREINKANWRFAHRLFQFAAVAVRPLRVEELAELLAFDFEAGQIPKFHRDWRLEDPMHAVLATCPSFLAIVHGVVQFSHFSVKEFLTSVRLAEANDIILRRYHISETPAHTLAARACLGYLLHLDEDVTSDSLPKLPFAEYSAKYWVDHARLEDVSRNVEDGLKELFDTSKPHLAVCLWIRDWKLMHRSKRPSPPRGTPLHYIALWGLHSVVELLINEHSPNVNSQDFTDSATPLHVAASEGHLQIARRLLECDTDVNAQNEDKETPLHVALKRGHLEVARMLIERGADMSTPDKDSEIPLHLALRTGKLEVARMLLECGADASSQDRDGRTPLHMELEAAVLGAAKLKTVELEVIRLLIERDTGVSARDKDGRTPLHLVSLGNWYPRFGTFSHPEVARMLIEHGVDLSAQDNDGQTPLHLASQAAELEVARMLIEHGADASIQNKDGQTPLHLVSLVDWDPYPELARMLIEHGADVLAQDQDGRTPIDLASQARRLAKIDMFLAHGTDTSAHK